MNYFFLKKRLSRPNFWVWVFFKSNSAQPWSFNWAWSNYVRSSLKASNQFCSRNRSFLSLCFLKLQFLLLDQNTSKDNSTPKQNFFMAVKDSASALAKRLRKKDAASSSLIPKLLKNPKWAMTLALLIIDSILVSFIIAYIPCKIPKIPLYYFLFLFPE